MVNFETKLVHQDVLTVCVAADVLYAGIGCWIFAYKGRTLQSKKQIFEGQKIHCIKSDYFCENSLIVFGGKSWGFCDTSGRSHIVPTFISKNNDWILDAESIDDRQIVLITSHNEAQIWDKGKKEMIKSASPTERCILYSAKVHIVNDRIFILAGTVFSHVLVWELTDPNQAILYHLKGHTGVIFSISVATTRDYPVVICTTSDDRSVRLYHNDSFVSGNFVANPPLFAHTARVWKAVTLFDNVLTIGEDSLLCVWNYEGDLISKTELHQGGGIQSATCRNDSFITGGSDGGIFELLPDSLFVQPTSTLIDVNYEAKEIPRKVAFFGAWGIVCLTNKRLLYRTDHGHFKEITDGKDLLPKCTDLATSNGTLIGLSTVAGFILVHHIVGNEIKTEVLGDNGKCQSLQWHESFLMVGIENGFIKLLDCRQGATTAICEFQLPNCKDRSPSCFIRLGSNTLIGDRNGNLHVYRDSSLNPQQTLKRLHGYLGISDILFRKKDETILTTGAGGRVKLLFFQDNELIVLQSFAVPMESSARLIECGQRIIVGGFHGSSVKLWDLDQRLVIGSFQCGGGHRSFDFRNFRSSISFLFIKEKNVHQVPFNIDCGDKIRESFHSKMINCLQVLDQDVIVSGGDDNVLRITKLNEDDITPVHVLEQHISSIRSVRVIDGSDADKKLIISVGGREQICLTEYYLKSQRCREICSYFRHDSPAEGRFMCVETLQQTDNNPVTVLVGCSDCTIRVLHLINSSYFEAVATLVYKNCLLNLCCVMDFVVSFATDGQAVFWDLSGGCIPTKPALALSLHQSGINSALISMIEPDTFCLATGGDDNMLCISMLKLTRERTWQVISRWASSACHSCQITGLVLHKDWLVSTSIDQKLVIHKLTYKKGEVHADAIKSIVTTVPDAHGLTLLHSTPTTLQVCIFGKGIQIIEIQHLSEL